MKWTVTTHSVALYLSEILQKVKRGKQEWVWTIELKRKPKLRSNDQNAYLWGVVYPHFLLGLVEAGWELEDLQGDLEEGVEPVDAVEITHEWCKVMFASRSVVNRHTGEIVNLPRSTAKMTTMEFTTYVDKIKEHASEFLGVIIPEANEGMK